MIIYTIARHETMNIPEVDGNEEQVAANSYTIHCNSVLSEKVALPAHQARSSHQSVDRARKVAICKHSRSQSVLERGESAGAGSNGRCVWSTRAPPKTNATRQSLHQYSIGLRDK